MEGRPVRPAGETSAVTFHTAQTVCSEGLITQEGWTVNWPKPEEIVLQWRPAPKQKVEEDRFVIQCVSQQTWTGLAIKDFGAEQEQGVVATRRFYTNDIVCDYHGKVITEAEGRAIVQSLNDEPGYCFFFKAGERELCVDSQNYPCESHPLTNTFGRRINHSSKMPNLKPFHCKMKINGEDKDIILFKALKDITVGTQLKYD
ncbi:N-lysine methyltransferase KMT5A-like [Pimephales promelas]|uniref:N-lysine methyltransferase KMT5A-like n=1 Tax=Pimephales promelas TaxID=90988 RepID=UPI001955C6D2|nr:N-lysine methyltransferase KMT5A-like [Pimephales promelas]